MPTNYALSSNGASVSVSSQLLPEANYPPASMLDGLRHTNNLWDSGGGWCSAPGFPVTVEVDFNAVRSISKIDLFFLADALDYNVAPGPTDTGTLYVADSYTVDYWNGTSWVNLASVAGNNLLWKSHQFAPVSASKIRLVVTDAIGTFNQAAIVEIEAWGSDPEITTTSLPNGTVGLPYDWTGLLNATGGTGSLAWTVVSGSLPPGFGALPTSGTGAAGTPTTAGTYNFTLRATDSLGAYDEQALSITIVAPPPVPENKWSRMGIVPRHGLLAWYQPDPDNGAASGFAPDFSGNGRHLAQATNPPGFDNIGTEPHYSWFFDGAATNPLVHPDPIGTVRHTFVIADADASLPDGVPRGLLTPLTGPAWLAHDASQSEFISTGIESHTYRRSDVPYAAGDWRAPEGGLGDFAIIELINPAGTAFDGVVLGRDRNNATRIWKGQVMEAMIYDRVLQEGERFRIFCYVAMKYWIWPRVASGLSVFPFAAQKATVMERDRETYLSEPYSGPKKALVRGGYAGTYGLQYLMRRQEEFKAARAFHEQHGKTAEFIFRDHRFCPAEDRTVVFTSPLRDQGSEVTYRFNYGFEVREQ